LTCPKARDTSGRESYDRGLPPFRRKPHDQVVSKSDEQKPEIIPGQILSGPQFKKPPANGPLAFWTFARMSNRVRRFVLTASPQHALDCADKAFHHPARPLS
jgi:hypothetical protein